MGFRVLGGRALRVDILEKFAAIARKAARAGPFAVTPEMLSLVGCDAQGIASVMGDLGYRVKETPEGPKFQPRNRRASNRGAAQRQQVRQAPVDPNSPFAKLRELVLTK